MSLLDTVIGALGSSQGGGNDPLRAIVGMLGQGGGLGGLVQKLQQAGLGDAVNSWVSTGQNLPVSPDALGSALGHDTVSNFANQLGLNKADALGQLSQLLPQVVDKLTPNGQVPHGDLGSMAGMGDLANMLGGFLKR
jgi:uncharacterized protein YidB (DUF937 family)